MKKLTFKNVTEPNHSMCLVKQSDNVARNAYSLEIDGIVDRTFLFIRSNNNYLTFRFTIANRNHYVNYKKVEFIIEY